MLPPSRDGASQYTVSSVRGIVFRISPAPETDPQGLSENRRGIAMAIRELLLRLYPRGFRKRTAEDFRTAFDACVARERRRGGVGAAALALCVLTLDSARAAAALRLREHRLRHLVDLHATPRA